MQNTFEVTSGLESETTLYDVVQFIQDSWKQLLAAGIVGAVLGFGGWFLLGTYKAELILNNASINTSTSINTNTNTSIKINGNTDININTNTNTNTNAYGLDLITLRTLQKSLPNLASHMLANERLTSDAKSMYRQMATPAWWIKGVVPIYAVSRADIKDLAGISKDLAGISKGLDAASVMILALNIHTDGDSRDSATNDAVLVAQFIKSGGAYLQIKSLLKGYEGESIGVLADIQNQISATQIEQAFLKDRLKGLEDLQKRFPSSAGINQQVVDLKEASAKYLPLIPQIIAVNNDIYQNKERLIRFNDRINQINLINQFLVDAMPLVEIQLDGILLSKSLLGIEDKLRKSLSAADVKNRQALDQLRSQLLAIEARYTKGLEANAPPASKKTGMLKATAVGLVGAGFLMLVFLLGRKVIDRLKKR